MTNRVTDSLIIRVLPEMKREIEEPDPNWTHIKWFSERVKSCPRLNKEEVHAPRPQHAQNQIPISGRCEGSDKKAFSIGEKLNIVSSERPPRVTYPVMKVW